jgi:hypothetical protein
MLRSRHCEPPDLIVATLNGVVTSRDQLMLMEWVRERIRTSGPVRVMLQFEQFAGWKPDATFDRADMWLRDDEGVSSIAFVGAPAWASAILTVVAQPLRRIPIAYFETEAAARGWLATHARTTHASSR